MIQDGIFCKNSRRLNIINYFYITLYPRCFTGLPIHTQETIKAVVMRTDTNVKDRTNNNNQLMECQEKDLQNGTPWTQLDGH